MSSITPFPAVTLTLQQHWHCPGHLHHSSHLLHLGRCTNLSVKGPTIAPWAATPPFCCPDYLLVTRSFVSWRCVTLHAPPLWPRPPTMPIRETELRAQFILEWDFCLLRPPASSLGRGWKVSKIYFRKSHLCGLCCWGAVWSLTLIGGTDIWKKTIAR